MDVSQLMQPVLEPGRRGSPSLMPRKWKGLCNARFLSSRSGKFALAPAGLKDERALGWHGGALRGEVGGEVISLYPVWRDLDGLYPRQLFTSLQLPVAVPSKTSLSADGLPGRTHVVLHPPFARHKWLTLPRLKSLHLSTPEWAWGAAIKR